LNAQLDGWDNKLGVCKIMLEKIVWNDRIMAIVARIVDSGWECVNAVAHITVGTRREDVKPKESNDLLTRWLADGSGDATVVGEISIEGRPVVDGTVKAIMSRMR
jgi:tRNA ligase